MLPVSHLASIANIAGVHAYRGSHFTVLVSGSGGNCKKSMIVLSNGKKKN